MKYLMAVRHYGLDIYAETWKKLKLALREVTKKQNWIGNTV